MYVDVDESAHQQLAIETIHQSSVARDYVSKVLKNSLLEYSKRTYLDLESAFESTSEETSERSENAGEESHYDGVANEWEHVHVLGAPVTPAWTEVITLFV